MTQINSTTWVVTVKIVRQYDGTFRAYACPYPAAAGQDGTPQGDRLFEGEWYHEIECDEYSEPFSDLQIMAEKLVPELQDSRGPDRT